MLPALILAAGTGTRLDPLTRVLAKPVVPLAGRTLIERVLEWLQTQGVADAVINLHHRPETITGVVGDGSAVGLRIQYSWEPEILGSAGGPRHALPLLEGERFLIVNGDTLVNFALGPMIAEHRARGAEVTVAVVPNPRPHHYHGMRLDADDRVTGFVLKGSGEPSWHFVGVQVAESRVFASLEDKVAAETVTGLYRQLVASRPGALRGFRAQTTFLDVGTSRDYLDAALRLAAPEPNAIEAGASIDPGARVTRSVVWRDAAIADGAALEGCIVVSGVQVPSGLSVRHSILLPQALARPEDVVERIGTIAIASVDGGSERSGESC